MDFNVPTSYLIHPPKMKIYKSDMYEAISLNMLGLSHTASAYRKKLFHPYTPVESKFYVYKDDMGSTVQSTFDEIIEGKINYYVSSYLNEPKSKYYHYLTHKHETKNGFVCERTFAAFRLLTKTAFTHISYKKKATSIYGHGVNIEFQYHIPNFYENSIRIKYLNKFDVTEHNINPFTFVWPWDRDDGYFEMILMEHSLRSKHLKHIK